MGSGFSKMKKQARALEEQYEKTRKELESVDFLGSSGSGLVQVVISGNKQVKQIKIKRECVDPNDIEGLEDLIKAAFNEACKKADERSPSSPFGF